MKKDEVDQAQNKMCTNFRYKEKPCFKLPT